MTNITINSLPTASTIDAVNDVLPIYTNSLVATQGINRNTLLNLLSQPVGLTDSQTLTNKTLTAPAISAPVLSGTVTGTYTLGGTPTFPATIVTTTGSQTLTNKTLTSPTINSATISNPTLSVDTITGYSVATNVTAGGVTLNNGAVGGTTGTFSGLLTASNGFTLSSGTLTLPNNSIVAANLATTAITLGYAQITSNATCPASVGSSNQQASGLSATVTIPAGGRRVKITAFVGECFDTGANGGVGIAIWDGTVGSGTQLALSRTYAASKSANASIPLQCMVVVSPSAGSKTYNIGMFEVGGVGTATLAASSTEPAFILVEAI
jgi:hypothetical protein